MKLTNELKFRFIDNRLKPEEIEKLTPKDWEKLYKYKANRDKEIINAVSDVSSSILNGVILFVLIILGIAFIKFLWGLI